MARASSSPGRSRRRTSRSPPVLRGRSPWRPGRRRRPDRIRCRPDEFGPRTRRRDDRSSTSGRPDRRPSLDRAEAARRHVVDQAVDRHPEEVQPASEHANLLADHRLEVGERPEDEVRLVVGGRAHPSPDHGLIGAVEAAAGMGDDEDLPGPEKLLAHDDRTDRVLGREPAGIADEIRKTQILTPLFPYTAALPIWAAAGMGDDEDLPGPEKLLAHDDRTDRVLGREPAGIAD